MRCKGLVILLLLTGCSVDDRYFDPLKTDAYILGFDVIPQSRVEEVSFTSNGNLIFGIFVQAESVDTGATTTAVTILYNHGNSDNIDNYCDNLELLEPLDYNLFIYDYQGFGKSTGSPTLSDSYQNAEDALAFLKTRPEVDPTQIAF